MAHEIVDEDEFTEPITVADGADTHSTMAEVVEAFVQALANRTEHLRLHWARLAAPSNAFTGDVSVGGNLAVGGNATLPTISGAVHVVGGVNADSDLHSGNDISADRDLTAGRDVFAAGSVFAGQNSQFFYWPAASRALQVNLNGLGALEGSFGEFVSLGSLELVNVPLAVPHGAQLGMCRVKLTGEGVGYLIYARKKAAINMANTTLPVSSNVNTASGTLGAVAANIQIDFGNLTVSKDERYWISIQNTSGSGLLNIHAVEMIFADPGPRNY